MRVTVLLWFKRGWHITGTACFLLTKQTLPPPTPFRKTPHNQGSDISRSASSPLNSVSWVEWGGRYGWAVPQTSVLRGEAQKRKMRSKIWWFTEPCNSHYVSHFAAFFIVTEAKISIVKSCLRLFVIRITFGLALLSVVEIGGESEFSKHPRIEVRTPSLERRNR